MPTKRRQSDSHEPRHNKRLGVDFYKVGTVAIARKLLGKTLARKVGKRVLRAIIVETEAYLSSGDPASHSNRGLTRRNETMFLSPGKLYVYTIHQQHCMNVVTEPEGAGAAVLIRAAEPTEGVDLMLAARGLAPVADEQPPTPALLRRCTQGPGRLCSAFDITLASDSTDLVTSKEVWIEDGKVDLPNFQIKRSRRIGISRAVERQLRFFVDGNYFVSGCARDHSTGRSKTFR